MSQAKQTVLLAAMFVLAGCTSPYTHPLPAGWVDVADLEYGEEILIDYYDDSEPVALPDPPKGKPQTDEVESQPWTRIEHGTPAIFLGLTRDRESRERDRELIRSGVLNHQEVRDVERGREWVRIRIDRIGGRRFWVNRCYVRRRTKNAVATPVTTPGKVGLADIAYGTAVLLDAGDDAELLAWTKFPDGDCELGKPGSIPWSTINNGTPAIYLGPTPDHRWSRVRISGDNGRIVWVKYSDLWFAKTR